MGAHVECARGAHIDVQGDVCRSAQMVCIACRAHTSLGFLLFQSDNIS